MGVHLRPASLDEALDALAAAEGRPTVVAGGTEFHPDRAPHDGWGRPMPRDVLDIRDVAGLGRIERRDGRTRIGALVTWAEVAAADLPPVLGALKAAADLVGDVQVRGRGTLVGNLCNASPVADGIPPLLIVDATVEAASRRGERSIPLADFVLGKGRTALWPDEIATAVTVRDGPAGCRTAFAKRGSTSWRVVSMAMVAGLVRTGSDGRIAEARFAVGACTPVACRLPALEDDLVGREPGPDLAALVSPPHLAPLAAIDDARATAAERTAAVGDLLRDVLGVLCGTGAAA